MAATNQTKFWTYEDLFDLPDDGRRYEIIDGELYEMPAPIFEHALAIARLFALLLPVVARRGGEVLTAPLDVFMRGANPVQPDLIVLLPERFGFINKRGIEGPPDLIVEVLSPSNPQRDRLTKRALYERAGVHEYWLGSPKAASVEVLALDGETFRTHASAGGDELVTSALFPELSFAASAIFPNLIAE